MRTDQAAKLSVPDRVLHQDPQILQWDDWADPNTVRQIMKKQVEQVTYSQGRTKTAQGEHTVTDRRQCLNHIIGVNDRLCLTGLLEQVSRFLDAPQDHFEPGVLLKYLPGGYFQAHHDFNRQVWNGQVSHRVATLLLYINDDYQGGTTSFPRLGVKVEPSRGRAVFWRYDYPDSDKNQLLLHSGDPVISGIKYAVCFFLRDRPFLGRQRERMNY